MSNVVSLLSVVVLLLHNIILYTEAASSLASNLESMSSFVERHEGYSLLGHVVGYCKENEIECGLRCLRNESCQSYNCLTTNGQTTQACHLSGQTRRSKPENYKENKQWIYFELMKIASSRLICQNGWSTGESPCICNPGYKGISCQKERLGYFYSKPGHSCKHIRDSGDSIGDGEYWIDPEKNRNPFKAYCDMTTDGGGWLLVANLNLTNLPAPSGWTAEQTYRGISNYSNNRMGITKSAMNQLRAHLPFTQLRFHCSKQQGRTFHVTTVFNSTGEAVVRYFSGQTDVLPTSCGSFQRMANDKSMLSVKCDRWGNDGSHHVGKWGHYNKQGEKRMYDHAAFVAHKYHWVIVRGIWLCDDGGSNAIVSGGFWKIYVR